MSKIYDAAHLAGGMTADYWDRDPRRLGFVLARYKFVARMLQGMRRVLEVGCADGFGSRVVRQHVHELVAIDVDEASIEEAKARQSRTWPVEFRHHDILKAPLPYFDAVYALDVLEHIEPGEQEEVFLRSLRDCAPVAVLGMPSVESQEHASALSKAGHVNCMTEPHLRATLHKNWVNVFLFGMNDEVLHTGFGPMCHYRLALCTS